MSYPDVLHFIDGAWRPAASGKFLDIENPATGERIGGVACAGVEDLDIALEAAERGFAVWRNTPARERAQLLNRAAALIRERVEPIARLMSIEQGKPLAEARVETALAGDVMDWFAAEAVRTYGRVIPARAAGVQQLVIKEPVGPVAAFTPWNFPINQTVRKIAPALAAGCSIIVKGPEDTPASVAELVRVFAEAGLPNGVVNLVFGIPAEISGYLIPHPVIRKVSFTGSVAVGKQLAALAGLHMKRVTMELGGHAPVIVAADADIAGVAKLMSGYKFRAAGQTCISPTRFMIARPAYDEFLSRFVDGAKAVKVGEGFDPATTMGPLVSMRRVEAVQSLVDDAVQQGARLETGGGRIGNRGAFFAPTILSQTTPAMRIMNEEPFGPVALINPYDDLEEALTEANRLPVGLASFAFTRSAALAHIFATRIEAGMVTINHLGLTLPETPFGGIGDSGYGSEGGAEAIESYLTPKFVTQLHTAG